MAIEKTRAKNPQRSVPVTTVHVHSAPCRALCFTDVKALALGGVLVRITLLARDAGTTGPETQPLLSAPPPCLPRSDRPRTWSCHVGTAELKSVPADPETCDPRKITVS